MSWVVVVLGAFVAVAAAVRSTWSPCGQSMLSTVTPVGERQRGARFGWTAGWFVVGAIAGGVTLGGFAAVPAALVHASGPSSGAVAAAAAVVAVVSLASDLRLGGFRLPWHHRQVNELWLGRYRPWLYGAGFGWQIGFGLVTYIMTAAVYLTFVLAALTGSPAMAVAVCACFGAARGLAVVLGARLTSAEALRAFHRRFDALAPVGLCAVVGAEMAAIVVSVGVLVAWPTIAVLASGVLVQLAALVAAVPVLSRGSGMKRTPSRSPSFRAVSRSRTG